ncbi:DinB family protein [Algoriphagus hitonicola]|uniref:DinB family protein n=1 Tax=Algoriphagus hitonicola TaxID=435880 RepID=A0A1I2SFH8_9BACT|nr:DinB family protein [Algoriphagus hitonicola]SFG48811.1 DinB family protein [Algoriphagus hitonicola]
MKTVSNTLLKTLLSGLMLVAFTSVSAQTTMEEFMSKWENSKQFTLDVLDKMPDSGMDYKTDPEAMSFKEQIHHIGSAVAGISQGYLMGENPEFSIELATATKAELAEYVGKCFDYAAATMKALPADKAGEVIEVFGNQVSRRQVMALLMDHTTHHRGAAIAYLRANGVEPPAFVGF